VKALKNLVLLIAVVFAGCSSTGGRPKLEGPPTPSRFGYQYGQEPDKYIVRGGRQEKDQLEVMQAMKHRHERALAAMEYQMELRRAKEEMGITHPQMVVVPPPPQNGGVTNGNYTVPPMVQPPAPAPIPQVAPSVSEPVPQMAPPAPVQPVPPPATPLTMSDPEDWDSSYDEEMDQIAKTPIIIKRTRWAFKPVFQLFVTPLTLTVEPGSYPAVNSDGLPYGDYHFHNHTTYIAGKSFESGGRRTYQSGWGSFPH